MKKEGIKDKTNLDTIYDTVIESRNGLDPLKNFPNLIRCLHTFYVETISETNKISSKISEYINSENDEKIKITGLMIKNENVILHFIEGEEKDLKKYFLFIKKKKDESPKIKKVKFLVYNEEFNKRIFKYWGFDKFSFKMQIDLHSEKSEKENEKNIWNIYKKFLLSGDSISNKLEKVDYFTPEILKEALNYIHITTEETNFLFSKISLDLDEFFDIYYQYEFLEDNERIWPVKPFISQLLEFQIESYHLYNGINLTK